MEMDLRDFVKQALVDIVTGVVDAVSAVKGMNNGAVVSPALLNGPPEALFVIREEDGYGQAFPVKFDLSVTVTSAESQKKDMSGGLKISILSGKAGLEESDTSTKTAVQRLQFMVPVKFPQTPLRSRPSNRPSPASDWQG